MTSPQRRLGKHVPKCCPACGQVIIDSPNHLSPMQRRIFDLVKKLGQAHSEVLVERIWNESNTPAWPKQTLHVHIHNVNRKLYHLGLAIRSTNRGCWSAYRLVKEAAE